MARLRSRSVVSAAKGGKAWAVPSVDDYRELDIAAKTFNLDHLRADPDQLPTYVR
jgi:hypothetical protein